MLIPMEYLLSLSFNVVINILFIGVFRYVLVRCNRTMLGLYTAYRYQTPKVVAFFHPYCDSGGGGERVLRMTINAILEGCDSQADLYIVVIYKRSKKDILRHERKVQHKLAEPI